MAVCLPGEGGMQVPPLAVQSHSHFMAGELAVCAGAVPSRASGATMLAPALGNTRKSSALCLYLGAAALLPFIFFQLFWLHYIKSSVNPHPAICAPLLSLLRSKTCLTIF